MNGGWSLRQQKSQRFLDGTVSTWLSITFWNSGGYGRQLLWKSKIIRNTGQQIKTIWHSRHLRCIKLQENARSRCQSEIFLFLASQLVSWSRHFKKEVQIGWYCDHEYLQNLYGWSFFRLDPKKMTSTRVRLQHDWSFGSTCLRLIRICNLRCNLCQVTSRCTFLFLVWFRPSRNLIYLRTSVVKNVIGFAY